MSTFKGRVMEIPGVIVDHFSGSNLKFGQIFFLSHCHKDHMEGITSTVFLQILKKRNSHLYCSEVTKALLQCDPECDQLVPYLKDLPMEDPVTLSHPESNNSYFTITLLPAGHCPGSTMFLFESNDCNVLYTGDFRLRLDDIRKLNALHSNGKVIPLDALYIDTTFCHPKVMNLPTRDESRENILLLMETWLSKSSRHVVHLDCNSFGYEHIYLGVFQKFNTKVHLSEWRYRAYGKVPAVQECVTVDGGDTRVHACRALKGQKFGKGLPCGAHGIGDNHPHVLRIKPSTQWFARHTAKFTTAVVYVNTFNMYRVLHSMHASFSEIRQFAKYLQPKVIVPCVVTGWDNNVMDVTKRLRDCIPMAASSHKHPSIKSYKRANCVEGNKEKKVALNKQWSSGDDTESEYATESGSENETGEQRAMHSEYTPNPLESDGVWTSSEEEEQSHGRSSGHQTSLDLSPPITRSTLDTVPVATLSNNAKQCRDSIMSKTKVPQLEEKKCNSKSQNAFNHCYIDLTSDQPSSQDSYYSGSTIIGDVSPLPSSQSSSKSWLPQTPGTKITNRSLAFEDL